MLTISTTARDAIASIQSQTALSDQAGLRIARLSGGTGHLQVRAASGPRSGDRTLDYDGARVFLGPHALRELDDRLLDVRRDDSGRFQFVCSPRSWSFLGALPHQR